MSESKFIHSQSGLTACGGVGNETTRSCIKFVEGNWTTLTEDLLYDRSEHVSWRTPDGDILLIGGAKGSFTTSEIVLENGTSIESFDLKYQTE